MKRIDGPSYQAAMRSCKRIVPAIVAALALAASPVAAQETVETPYWASVRASEVNMRVGPGEDYRILWVYKRPNLPLKVLRLKEGWRLVRDPDGAEGWVLARFLTRQANGFVTSGEPTEMRESAGKGKVLWRLAPGVIGRLGKCDAGWCELSVDERHGFVRQNRLWGAGEP